MDSNKNKNTVVSKAKESVPLSLIAYTTAVHYLLVDVLKVSKDDIELLMPAISMLLAQVIIITQKTVLSIKESIQVAFYVKGLKADIKELDELISAIEGNTAEKREYKLERINTKKRLREFKDKRYDLKEDRILNANNTHWGPARPNLTSADFKDETSKKSGEKLK